MGDIMYYYFREYCEPYFQLMPVQYELKGDGKYHKTGMACSKKGICGKSLDQCKHYQEAPEIIDEKFLTKKKLGE